MSIPKQIVRRIQKFFSIGGDKPQVVQPGLNHVDNPNEFGEDGIYRGEIAINLHDGKLYTSDSDEILQIGTYDGIVSGMKPKKPPIAGLGIPLDVTVESGFIQIRGRIYEHISNDPNSDFQISPNLTANHRIDVIYAKGDKSSTNVNGNHVVTFHTTTAVTGSNAHQLSTAISKQIINYEFTQSDAIPLAIIWVPANYTGSSSNSVYPITYLLGKPGYPKVPASPSEIALQQQGFVQQYESDRVYLGGSLIIEQTTGVFYKVDRTYLSSGNADDDDTAGFLTELVGGSGGGPGGGGAIKVDRLPAIDTTVPYNSSQLATNDQLTAEPNGGLTIKLNGEDIDWARTQGETASKIFYFATDTAGNNFESSPNPFSYLIFNSNVAGYVLDSSDEIFILYN